MRLVLCDGQRLLLDALATALADAGHHVEDVCDLPEALPDLVDRRRPEVCVLEAAFRGTTRLDAVAAVRDSRPETVVVLLTGEAPAAIWRAYDDHTVDAVVSKSSPFGVVDSVIRDAHHGRRQVAGFRRPSPQLRPPQPAHHALTAREHQVLRLLFDGASTRSMAARLGVSTNTVRTHVASVLRKLGAHDRGKAVSTAVELGLV